MALGFGGAAASPDVWVAAACAAVGGAGDGAAIVCNAVLVQRGAADEVRGRALTLVMSATFLATAAANAVAGALLHSVSPRWIWAGAATTYGVAAVVGYVLARDPRPAAATVEPAH
jgi:MFS family permease